METNGQCFDVDGIFYNVLMSMITDLAVVETPQIPEPKVKIDPRVKFVFFGDRSYPNSHDGVITIASYVNEDIKRVFFGVSYCSPNDVFDKVKGKELAYTRMMTDQYNVGYNVKGHKELTSRILAAIYANNTYPSWSTGVIEYTLFSYMNVLL